jgi:hypothetical protein
MASNAQNCRCCAALVECNLFTCTKSGSCSKANPEARSKNKTVTITEIITIDIPGESYSAADAVAFEPNPLIASVYPGKVIGRGQVAKFSSNPSSHYGSGIVLGRQAEVHFVPVRSSWTFSDGVLAGRR